MTQDRLHSAQDQRVALHSQAEVDASVLVAQDELIDLYDTWLATASGGGQESQRAGA